MNNNKIAQPKKNKNWRKMCLFTLSCLHFAHVISSIFIQTVMRCMIMITLHFASGSMAVATVMVVCRGVYSLFMIYDYYVDTSARYVFTFIYGWLYVAQTNNNIT